MHLNTLSPSTGSKRSAKRLGRGGGSGFGKTCGRGHKGQKSRSGGKVSCRFEGGQTPLYRRLPKFGFTSRKEKKTKEIRLSDLARLGNKEINLNTLKSANIISKKILFARVIYDGKVSNPPKICGIHVTKGVRSAIESAGGNVKAKE